MPEFVTVRNDRIPTSSDQEDEELLNELRPKSNEDEELLKSYRSLSKGLGPRTQAAYASSLASIQRIAHPEQDIFQAYDAVDSLRNPAKAQPDIVNQGVAGLNEQTKDAVAYAIQNGNIDEIEPTLLGGREVVNNNIALVNDPLGAEKMEARIHAPPNTNIEDIKKYELAALQAKELSHMAEEMGLAGKGWDLAKMLLLPGRQVFDATEIRETPPLIGAFGTQDNFRKVIDYYQSLPAEKQKLLYEDIKETVFNAMNKTEAIGFMAKFLDPNGSSDLSEYNDWWMAFDAVDIGARVGGLALGLAAIANRANKMRRLTALGDTPTASKINTAGLVDETGDVADKAGVDRLTMANSAGPVKPPRGLDEAAADGVDAHTQARIKSIRDELKQIFKNIISGPEAALVTRPMSEGDIAQAISSFEKRAIDEAMENSLEVGGMQTTRNADNSFTTTGYLYDLNRLNPDSPAKPIKAKKTWRLTLNDNGEYFAEMGSNARSLSSPKFLFRNNSSVQDDVSKMIIADNVSQRLQHQLAELYLRANKLLKGLPLKRRAKSKRVNQALADGRDHVNEDGLRQSKVFEERELRQKYGLEDDEIEYYHAIHGIMEGLHEMVNLTEYRTAALKGFKSISLGTGASSLRYIIHPYKDYNSALKAAHEGSDTHAYNTTTGRVVSLTEKSLNRLYAENKVLVRTTEDHVSHAKSGQKFNLIVVDKSRIDELPINLIEHFDGYLPIIYNRGVYATQMVKRGTVNGVPNRVIQRKTLNTYDNIAERDAHMATLNQRLKDAGEEGFELEKINPGGDTKLNPLDEPLGGTRRLFSGKRAEKEIPFGSGDDVASKTDPIDSMERLMSHVATHYPRAEWRLAAFDRLEKYAKQHNLTSGEFDINRPFNTTTVAGQTGERLRKEILDWARMRTREESITEQKWRDVYEWMVGRKLSGRSKNSGVEKANKWRQGVVARTVFNSRNADVPATMRSLAFHPLLGFWNPAQLWVQGQAFLVSASVLDPRDYAKATRAYTILHMIQHIEDSGFFAVSGKIGRAMNHNEAYLVKKMAKVWDVTEKDAIAIIRLYRKSGLDEGVKATGDLVSVEAGISSGYGMMSRFLDNGLTFFRSGERINRRFSFITAMARFARKNKNVKFSELSESDIQHILTDSESLRFAMGRSNRAPWQKGWTSVPSIFMQVQAKYIEELMNTSSTLSKSDRFRIGFTQLLLYGAAGMPFVGAPLARVAGGAIGFSQDELGRHPAIAEGISNGVLQAVVHNILGADVEIASRGAILNYLDDYLLSLWTGNKSVAELLSGAFGVFPERVFGGAKDLLTLSYVATASGTLNEDVMKQAILSVAGVFSSLDNASKAYLMVKTGKITGNDGSNYGEAGFMTAVGQLFGFSPSAIPRAQDINARNKSIREIKKTADQAVIDLLYNSIKIGADVEDSRARMLALGKLAYPSETERKKAMKRIWDRIHSPKTKHEEYLKEYIDNRKAGWADSMLSLTGRAAPDLTLENEDGE